MISEKKFFKIIKESKDIAVSDEIINNFHNSIPLSYIFWIIGFLEFEKLYEKETANSLPLLEMINSCDLDIWEKLGADKEIVKKFVDFINQEKELRANNGDWAKFRKVIYGRIELYPEIFKFSKEDISFCEMAAEEFKKKKEEKEK